jgi:hypothetical protein
LPHVLPLHQLEAKWKFMPQENYKKNYIAIFINMLWKYNGSLHHILPLIFICFRICSIYNKGVFRILTLFPGLYIASQTNFSYSLVSFLKKFLGIKILTKHFFLHYPKNKIFPSIFPRYLIPGINCVSTKQTPPKSLRIN